GVPVLASDMIEIRKIIEEYDVGICINDHSPENIARTINHIFANESQRSVWKQNTQKAKEELNWEAEEQKLLACLDF
ncbi:MAG: glycosyltransferase, partial [Chlorobiales bacterium]|nr:glycosyltransferase [Chlorobiales bacterium]